VNKGVNAMLSPDFIRHEPELGDRTTGERGVQASVNPERSALSDFHTEATDTIEQVTN
jgi:hypothetical protein